MISPRVCLILGAALLLALCPSWSWAVSPEYQQAQTKYNQADAAYQKVLNKYHRLGDESKALSAKIDKVIQQMKNLGFFEAAKGRRLAAELERLQKQREMAIQGQSNLEAALDFRARAKWQARDALEAARQEVSLAEAALSRAKQRRQQALRALNRVRDQGRTTVVYTPDVFGRPGDQGNDALRQILERWSQLQTPGSRLITLQHY